MNKPYNSHRIVYELNQLRDVEMTAPSNGSVLTYNSTDGEWKNNNNIAITSGACNVNIGFPSARSIRMGYISGSVLDNNNTTITIGSLAGNCNHNSNAVSIGSSAGNCNRGSNSVAIGQAAGQTNAVNTHKNIAIGSGAGIINQGEASIAIGFNAGNPIQPNNSICINATGNSLNPTVTNSLFIKPIRRVDTGLGVGTLNYNSGSGEITYSGT